MGSRKVYNSTEGRAYNDRLYNIRRRGTREFAGLLIEVLQAVHRELVKEEKSRQHKSKVLWAASDKLVKEAERQTWLPFHQKIFQPRICIDCNTSFETLFPDGIIAGKQDAKIIGSVRCKLCRYSHRLAIHGGGPSRRCRQYGVPYESISYRVIFLRDKWTCQICGISTPESKRGTFDDDAPEVDHIWPLSLVKNGAKSPGHILSNCRTACRKCNIELGAKGNQ